MADSSHHLEGAVACSKCDAINPHGAELCVECGSVLGDAASESAGEDHANRQRDASTALRQGYRWIGGVSWLFRAGAFAYGIVTLVAVVALASTSVPVGPGVLVVVLSTLLTGLMMMGAIRILFQPFEWTLAVAALATVVTVAHLIGPNPLGLAFLWSAAWAVAFWTAVVPMLRFRRLMAMHQDLYITHHASQKTKRGLRGRSPAERHERLQRAMHRASRRAWAISGAAAAVVCLASLIGTYTVCSHQRPESLAMALGEFEDAWNQRSLMAVHELFVPRNRDEQSELLEGVVESYGWKNALPRLKGGRERRANGRLWVDYEVDGKKLATRWVLDGTLWRLVQVQLPRPPHDDTVERFLEAWQRSDLESIGRMFRSDTRQEMLDAVDEALQRRGWERLPKILSKQTSENEEDGEVDVSLGVATGDVTVTFAFRSDGRWGVRAIRFPKP